MKLIYCCYQSFLLSRGRIHELLANQLSKMPGRSNTTANVVRDASYTYEKTSQKI